MYLNKIKFRVLADILAGVKYPMRVCLVYAAR